MADLPLLELDGSENGASAGKKINDSIEQVNSNTHDTTDNTAGLLTKEDNLGNPPSSGYLLTSTPAGSRTWVAYEEGGVQSVNQRTGVVVLDANDVDLGKCDNTSDANKPISIATEQALMLKSDIDHNHDLRYYEMAEFIMTSTGVTDAGKPVALNTVGKIDSTMLEFDSLEYIGFWTPAGDSVETEYPITVDVNYGSIWTLAATWTFTSGDFAGEKYEEGATMLWSLAGWTMFAMDIGAYYKKSDHIVHADGPATAFRPVITDSNGKLSNSLIDLHSFEYQGGFTPVLDPGEEYPDTAGILPGGFWTLDIDFTWTTGDLIGETASSGDMLMYGASAWTTVPISLNPDDYLKKDGGIMSGAIYMEVAATLDNHLVRKDYVDTVNDTQDLIIAGKLDSVVAGTNITIDITNVSNPTLNVTDMTYDATTIQAEVDLNTAKDGITVEQTAAIVANTAKTGVTNEVKSDTTETGTTQIINMVSLTQAAYDALTPVATTFYVIVG